jgi:hypothetical protein
MGKIWPNRGSRDPGLHLVDALMLIGSVAIMTALVWFFF